MNLREESLEHLRGGEQEKDCREADWGLPSGVVMEHEGAREVRLGVES